MNRRVAATPRGQPVFRPNSPFEQRWRRRHHRAEIKWRARLTRAWQLDSHGSFSFQSSAAADRLVHIYPVPRPEDGASSDGTSAAHTLRDRDQRVWTGEL